jgi:hypothetical protein
VLKTARVGARARTDYIYADTVGRRLYISRDATLAQPTTDSRPEVHAFEKRLTIFNLDTLGTAFDHRRVARQRHRACRQNDGPAVQPALMRPAL